LSAGKFIRAVAGADSDCERIATGTLYEFFRFCGIGQLSIFLIHGNMFFHAAEHSQFRFDGNVFGVRRVHHAFGDGDIFVESFVAGVDHYGRIKSGIDAIVTGFFVAVIQMNGENGFRKFTLRGANNGFQKSFAGVGTRAFGKLNNERRLRIDAAAEQADGLL
jgi:hypothetical protein